MQYWQVGATMVSCGANEVKVYGSTHSCGCVVSSSVGVVEPLSQGTVVPCI